MPSMRPAYKVCPGDRIEVEVVQPDGARALVVGKLDDLPEVAGGRALRIVVCGADHGLAGAVVATARRLTGRGRV